MHNPNNPCCAASMPRAEYPMPQPPQNGSGSCKPGSGCAAVMGQPLAMAYVAMQSFENLYSPEAALCAGTLFADLDKPFCGAVVSDSAYPRSPARTCSGMRCDCAPAHMHGAFGMQHPGKTTVNPANTCGVNGRGGCHRG